MNSTIPDGREQETPSDKNCCRSVLRLVEGGRALEIPPVSYWRRLCEDMIVQGKRSDFAFDQIYPGPIRSLSAFHWSPLAAIQKAVELLVVNSKTRVLDIGSGGGKFCIAGATLSQAWFTGVERQAELAGLACQLVQSYGVQRVSILHGEMEDLDWSRFNAFYLYNPFHELLLGPSRALEQGMEQYRHYVRVVQQKLMSAPLGSRVVTYHGFGGMFPFGYVRAHRETLRGGDLELWIHRGR